MSVGQRSRKMPRCQLLPSVLFSCKKRRTHSAGDLGAMNTKSPQALIPPVVA